MQTPGDALSYITPIGESFILFSPPTIRPRAVFPACRWLVAFYGEAPKRPPVTCTSALVAFALFFFLFFFFFSFSSFPLESLRPSMSLRYHFLCHTPPYRASL